MLQSLIDQKTYGQVKQDLTRAVNTAKYYLLNSYYLDPESGSQKKVKGGLISGWRFTSLFGSLLSYAMIENAMDIVTAIDPSSELTSRKYHGDDVDGIANSLSTAELLLSTILDCQVDLHPQKQMITETRD